MLITVRRAVLSALVSSVLSAGVATDAIAHFVTADEAVVAIKASALGAKLDLVSVAPHEELPRMLVVRVREGWSKPPAELKVKLAAEWRALWREATDQGLVAIVDEAGHSLVSFDGNGTPQLRE